METMKRVIVEIQYKATPKFFDCRGQVIESGKKYFQNWSVVGNNSVKLTDEKRKITGIATHKNTAVEMLNPDISIFQDTSKSFLRNTLEIIDVKPKDFTRIGVRTFFAKPFSESMDKLVIMFKEKMLRVNENNLPSGFKIKDVGFPFVLAFDDKMCNVTVGPMEKYQFTDILQGTTNLPDVGIYLDVDYFKNDLLKNKSANPHTISEYLDKGIRLAEELKKSFFEILAL